MKYRVYFLLSILASYVILCTSSCGGGGESDDIGTGYTPQRGAFLGIYPPPSGTNSLSIYFRFSVGTGLYDTIPKTVSKLEFDPGDGRGWLDVTDF
jgi:hypothetical protein